MPVEKPYVQRLRETMEEKDRRRALALPGLTEEFLDMLSNLDDGHERKYRDDFDRLLYEILQIDLTWFEQWCDAVIKVSAAAQRNGDRAKELAANNQYQFAQASFTRVNRYGFVPRPYDDSPPPRRRYIQPSPERPIHRAELRGRPDLVFQPRIPRGYDHVTVQPDLFEPRRRDPVVRMAPPRFPVNDAGTPPRHFQ